MVNVDHNLLWRRRERYSGHVRGSAPAVVALEGGTSAALLEDGAREDEDVAKDALPIGRTRGRRRARDVADRADPAMMANDIPDASRRHVQ